MDEIVAYLPQDRRTSLATGIELPRRALGAVLFADISGFTPLTEALTQNLGPRRGAEELTRLLNRVYDALIGQVDRYGGSVIGFSGDAITCWFDDLAAQTNASLRAMQCACHMTAEMQAFATLSLSGTVNASLTIKIAIATGAVQRWLVGDPRLHLVDVIAGATLDRVASAEHAARQGECLVDLQTVQRSGGGATVREWRRDGEIQFAVIENDREAWTTASDREPARLVHDVQLDTESIARFLHPAVAARVQSGAARFLAELRPAAALFLRFQGIDYDHDDQAAAKLDAFVRWVQQVLQRYEGVLIQLTTGDKGSYLYAAFGAPVAHDDDASRAMAAGLDLRSPPSELSFITRVQIGMAHGLMRTGAYGSTTRRTYGVLGDATNLAARLMTRAQPGQVLVSASMAALAGGRFQTIDLGAFALKGKSSAQQVFALFGRRPDATQLFGRLHNTPLVGRESELAAMTAALLPVRSGMGQILRISGDTGIGKSHLIATFSRLAEAQGFVVTLSACQSTTTDAAYFAARQTARSLFGLDAAETGESVAAQIVQVTATIEAMNRDWLVRLPLLGDLLGLPIPDNSTTASFDPRLRQEALTTLAVEIVLARAQLTPLVLVAEDIHWMDEASQGLTMALAHATAAAPILLVIAHRPVQAEGLSFLHEVAALPRQTHIALGEMSQTGVAELAAQQLQGEVSPLALELIQTQAQGNPLVIQEVLEALVSGGRLQRTDKGDFVLSDETISALAAANCLEKHGDEWRLIAHAPLAAVDLGVPNSIQGIVLARLDRLSEATKFTLKVASVIGRVFALDLLRLVMRSIAAGAMATSDSEQTAPAPPLDEALGRDFVRLEHDAPAVYLFRHNIIQEVAYGSLLQEQQRELHQAVAAAMERLQPDAVDRLAFHFYRSDLAQPPVRQQALHYLEAAGVNAQRDYANETALTYFDRALGLETRWEWLKTKVEILHILGRRTEEREILAALQTAPAAPQQLVSLLYSDYFEAISDYTAAAHAVQTALEIAHRQHDTHAEGRALSKLGLIAWRQGNYTESAEAYSQVLSLLQESTDALAETADAHYGLGLVFRQQGRYDDAQAAFLRTLEINRQLGNRQHEGRTLNALGHVQLLQRRYAEAVNFYQQALEIRTAIGDRAGRGTSMTSLAQGLRSMGDYGRAEPLLREALALHTVMGDRWSEVSIYNELGIVYMLVGFGDQAARCLDQGLEIARTIGDEAGQAYLLCNLGQVEREAGRLDAAQAILHQSMEMAHSQGDVHLEAICLSDLALVSLDGQDYEGALAHAQVSLARFQSLDLPLSTTVNWAVMAAAQLGLGERTAALSAAMEAVRILDACGGEGPDFPQRDYWLCAHVFVVLSQHDLAVHARQQAHVILSQQASRISNPLMRDAFLHNVSFNAAINAAQPVDTF